MTKPTIKRAINKDSDQPAHLCRLIRVFADHMYLLQFQLYPKSDKLDPLPHWVDIQADLSLCWSHRSYCWFCRALAHFISPQKLRHFCLVPHVFVDKLRKIFTLYPFLSRAAIQ